jgi:excisionase family DNA binding protein
MEKLLTAEEVAQILNVSRAWVYDHAYRKQPAIPCVRLGKAVRFRPEDVRTFIEAMIRRVA